MTEVELANMIAAWPAHYQDLGPDNEFIGDRVSHDRDQDIWETPALLRRLASAILAKLPDGPKGQDGQLWDDQTTSSALSEQGTET